MERHLWNPEDPRRNSEQQDQNHKVQLFARQKSLEFRQLRGFHTSHRKR